MFEIFCVAILIKFWVIKVTVTTEKLDNAIIINYMNKQLPTDNRVKQYCALEKKFKIVHNMNVVL